MEIQPTTEREDLIYRLNKKSLRLSYSTLKQFTSPINLINYKLKPFHPSPSMIFGSLCDVLLLTPEKFHSEFKVIESIPITDNQMGFSSALIDILKTNDLDELSEDVIKIQFDNYYKRGDCLKTYEGLKEYIYAKSKGLTLITQEVLDEANEVCDNLMANDDIQILFGKIIETQKKVAWDELGWGFVGFLDMYLQDHIIDLKFSKDANPEKFERDIANYDYFLQAAMYCRALKKLGISENPRYSFIVYDKSFNFSIIELDYSYINYGDRKFRYLIQELDRCIEEGSFDMSYGFFKRSYKAYKPKWAKGFELKED